MKKIISICALGLVSMMFAEAPAIYKRCASCHGVDGKSVKQAPKAIANLSKEEVITMLNGYKNKTIKGRTAAIMYGQTAKLTDEEIVTLAEYISTLK